MEVTVTKFNNKITSISIVNEDKVYNIADAGNGEICIYSNSNNRGKDISLIVSNDNNFTINSLKDIYINAVENEDENNV